MQRNRAESLPRGATPPPSADSTLSLQATGDKPDDKPATRSQETEPEKPAETEPSEQWKQVMADYPEIAKPLADELARISAGYRAEIDGLKQTQAQMATALQTVGEDRLAASSADSGDHRA